MSSDGHGNWQVALLLLPRPEVDRSALAAAGVRRRAGLSAGARLPAAVRLPVGSRLRRLIERSGLIGLRTGARRGIRRRAHLVADQHATRVLPGAVLGGLVNELPFFVIG